MCRAVGNVRLGYVLLLCFVGHQEHFEDDLLFQRKPVEQGMCSNTLQFSMSVLRPLSSLFWVGLFLPMSLLHLALSVASLALNPNSCMSFETELCQGCGATNNSVSTPLDLLLSLHMTKPPQPVPPQYDADPHYIDSSLHVEHNKLLGCIPWLLDKQLRCLDDRNIYMHCSLV